uniref:Putative UbiA prenyltransferase family protein n=1 Tax=viral metagenome TaxID=1070528 RepID=A0A6H1Z7P6_9ZZZZ
MKAKLKAHLWTLGRFFALPFFGVTLLCGAVIAGGSLGDLNVWLAFIAVTFVMAGGHSFNTLLDTEWTKLDKGEDTSVSKGYAAGTNVINSGILTAREVLANALTWYAIGTIFLAILAARTTPMVFIPGVIGMLVTFWYSQSKFTTWSHELALAAGPLLAAVLGALSTGTGEWVNSLLVSLPIVLIFSYAGLALDEHPDAEANLKKGVKSLPYKVWEFGFDLSSYLLFWFFLAYLVQVFFIAVDILAPLTGLSFVLLPLLIGLCVYLKGAYTRPDTFKKFALAIVVTAACYPILLLVGQALGG